MGIPDKREYFKDIIDVMKTHWPHNRIVNIVCHGHSVPAGYTSAPYVDTFNSYPYQLHRGLKERFPFAVVNVIVTARGGEASTRGAQRFDGEVLTHRPDAITIDYGLNDRGIGVEKARENLIEMINKSQEYGAGIILLTPTMDNSILTDPDNNEKWLGLCEQAKLIRELANEYNTGLVDSFGLFEDYLNNGGEIYDLLSWVNHPSAKGNKIVAKELLKWFPIC